MDSALRRLCENVRSELLPDGSIYIGGGWASCQGLVTSLLAMIDECGWMAVCGSLVQLALQQELVPVMARQVLWPPVANLELIKLMPALPWETFVKEHVNLSPRLSNSSSTFNFVSVFSDNNIIRD